VVVEGLDERARLVLPLLDGVRTREQVVAAAATAGVGDPASVLAALEEAGLLLDADGLQVPLPEREDRHRLGPDLAALTLVHGSAASAALRARRSARVVVHGAGRVGGPLAALLVEAGVGTVDLRDGAEARWEDVALGGLRPHDVGRPRAEALSARLRTLGSTDVPALVVLTEDVPELLARVLMRDRVPHLRAHVDGVVGTVGPLVLPGGSSCLRCVALVRDAIDPDWGALVKQGEPAVLGAGPSHLVLATAVAAQAALQSLELLEGGPPGAVGGTLELELPGWRWRRRTWPVHPGCDCGATPSRVAVSA
jgi:hypothetical protein